MHHQPRLSNKKIGTARIKKNLNKIAILFITYKDYTPLLLTHVINVQQILRNIYFFKKSQKNPNGSELQVKINVCIFYTPMKKNPKTTNRQTLGQDDGYALKYLTRKNSIKNVLLSHAMIHPHHAAKYMYSCLHRSWGHCLFTFRKKKKITTKLLLNKLHTIN